MDEQLDQILHMLDAIGDAQARAHLDLVVKFELAKLRDRVITVSDWASVVSLEGDIARLATETLAFVGGLSIRTAGLDGGICALADSLIEKTTRSMHLADVVTIPAPNEYLDLMSDVIRVRYPGGTIWDVPVALHELGHFAACRIGDGNTQDRPIETTIGREGTVPYLRNFAHELFADTFATYVCGPAYAFTCLQLRFVPAGAHVDDKPSHPAASTRAEAIFSVLRHLQSKAERSVRDDFGVIISDLASSWEALLASSPQCEAPLAAQQEYGQRLAGEFVTALEHQVPVVRYNQTNRAYIISSALLQQIPPAIDLETDSLITVLNAAWLARKRIERPTTNHKAATARGRPSLGTLTAAATQLCQWLVTNG